MLRKVGEWPDTINTTTKPENPNSDSGLDPQPLTLSSYRKVIPVTRGFVKWDENILAALDDNAWLTDEIVNFGIYIRSMPER
jgi:hypothetical protein